METGEHELKAGTDLIICTLNDVDDITSSRLSLVEQPSKFGVLYVQIVQWLI